MNNNLTELVFILDRSGSMHGLENDTIGGFNGLLEKQRAEQGEATVTTVLFDDAYEMLYDNADLSKVKELTNREYYARGCTALLDAIGRTVQYVEKRHSFAPESQVPGGTMVVIITDGFENASREYDLETVKKLISRQKEKGWEFMFLGANIDAVETAKTMGIQSDRAVTYEADSVGTQKNFACMSAPMTEYRSRKEFMGEWKKEIEEYHRKKMKENHRK